MSESTTTSVRIERHGPLAARVVGPKTGTPRGAVLLVHGVCVTAMVYRRWAETLADRGLEAWCLDLRGHGESEGADVVGSARVEDYAADIETMAERCGAQVLLGHDMGGLACQVVACRKPLRGLVLVGAAAPRGVTGRSNVSLLWRELRPRYVRALLRGGSWQPADADIAHLLSGKLDENDASELRAMLCPESGVAAREMVLSGVAVEDAKIRCPVLVVASTFDPLTPPARQRVVASRMRADYVEFAQHAHYPMIEPGWERPIAVIARWLEEAARIGETRQSASRIRRAAGETPLPGSFTPLPHATENNQPTPTPAPAPAREGAPAPPPGKTEEHS